MRYEWDARKNRSNIEKHRVDFEDAIAIFSGPILEGVDERQGYGEERWIAYGVLQSSVIAVVYADRDQRRRIISARKATKHEAEQYYQALFG